MRQSLGVHVVLFHIANVQQRSTGSQLSVNCLCRTFVEVRNNNNTILMNAITINKYLLYRIGIRIVLAEQSSNTRQQVPIQTSSYFMMFEIGRTSCPSIFVCNVCVGGGASATQIQARHRQRFRFCTVTKYSR